MLGLVMMMTDSKVSAGGTFFLDDLRGILMQQKALWRSLQSTFEIWPAGSATRIGWADNHNLAGTRHGPYSLMAKPKGARGPFVYEIEIETRTKFFDSSGKVVDPSEATTIKEEITAFKIRPLDRTEYFTPTKE